MSSKVYAWARGLRERSGEKSPWLLRRVLEVGHPVGHSLNGRSVAAADRNSHDHEGAGARSIGAEPANPLEQARLEEATLVQRVFLSTGPHAPRAVLFVGVEHDNASSDVCLRAGHMLARLTQRSVCVVDADLRAPKLQDLVGADIRVGLADAIANPEAACSFVRKLAPENLHLLAAGSATDVDALANLDRVSACLNQLATRFDHLVISAPAIDRCAESVAMSRLVDGVVLVLEAHTTRREIVRHVMARLADVDTPLLGIVLNNRTFPIPEAVYRLI